MIKTYRYIVIVLIICIACIACDNDKPKKPNNLIPEDKMTAIFYDMYIINAAKGVNRKLLEENGVVPKTYILNKHNIDSAQFANSNTYYTFYTEDYKRIVENVKTQLEKEKTEYDAILKIEDSIKNYKRDSIIKATRKKKPPKKILKDSVSFN